MLVVTQTTCECGSSELVRCLSTSFNSLVSRDCDGFLISWLYSCVSVHFVLKSAIRTRRTNICEVTKKDHLKLSISAEKAPKS